MLALWEEFEARQTPEARYAAASIAFLVAMALAQPPIVHGLFNRVEPWILRMPFLFAYLLAAYVIGIAVLIWAYRKGV